MEFYVRVRAYLMVVSTLAAPHAQDRTVTSGGILGVTTFGKPVLPKTPSQAPF